MTVAAILLAAGESTRMGRPKPLLPWGDVTLIEYQVRELLAAGVDDLVVVVLGHAAEEVRPHVPTKARVVLNKAYVEGRASSLRAGAAALPDNIGTIVVLNVDQPRPRDVLQQLLTAHHEGDARITLPTYEGKRGHPPVLAGSLLPELRAASEAAQGLRGIIGAHEAEVRNLAFDSAAVLIGLNTPDEYRKALLQFGLPSPSM